MLLGITKDDGGPWSPRDRELAKALLMYERAICSGCGQPAHEAQDPDRLGWYQVERHICVACMAIEKSVEKPEPGLRLSVHMDPNYVKRT